MYVQKAIIQATYGKVIPHVRGFWILVLNGFQFHPIPCRWYLVVQFFWVLQQWSLSSLQGLPQAAKHLIMFHWTILLCIIDSQQHSSGLLVWNASMIVSCTLLQELQDHLGLSLELFNTYWSNWSLTTPWQFCDQLSPPSFFKPDLK